MQVQEIFTVRWPVDKNCRTVARKLIDQLDQSILAKVFRGELVPQDKNDEPASVLLERIRAEHASDPTRGRRRSGRPRGRAPGKTR